MLPITSAASRQESAGGGATRRTAGAHAVQTREQIVAATFGDRNAQHVAGRAVGYHHRLTVDMADAPGSERQILDLNLELAGRARPLGPGFCGYAQRSAITAHPSIIVTAEARSALPRIRAFKRKGLMA